MKILPTGKFSFTRTRLNKVNEATHRAEEIDGVIEITEEQMQGILYRTHKFSDDLKSVIPINEEDKIEIESQRDEAKTHQDKFKARHERLKWMDVYRKYQASVNYGEIKRSEEVDTFIKRLKNNEVDLLKEKPKQLLYFLGQVDFKGSGLEEV